MMATQVFRLPDVGEGVVEAEIVAWHIKTGDRVGEDQLMVDIMTDKATVEMTSPVAGLVLATHGEPGERLAVGSPLVEFALEDAAPASVEAPGVNAPLASPATRLRAREQGVSLEQVSGTGPEGRITAADLDAYVAREKPAAIPADVAGTRGGVTEVKLTGVRRAIAKKMEATRRIPHFSYVEECDLTELDALREDLNSARQSDQPKLTFLPFFIIGLVRVLRKFPRLNAWYDDDAEVLRLHEAVHVGIATQTEAGLSVPVVRHTETRDLWDIARELTRVTTAARDGRCSPGDLTGSTITLTSLGALGGVAATPVINQPEVAIICPNKLVERAVVVDGQIAIRRMMNLSSSFDHRVVDGADAALFIQGLKHTMERPALLFMGRP